MWVLLGRLVLRQGHLQDFHKTKNIILVLLNTILAHILIAAVLIKYFEIVFRINYLEGRHFRGWRFSSNS